MFYFAGAEVVCDVLKNKAASSMQISTHAAKAIKYKSGQSALRMQVLDCKCKGDDNSLVNQETKIHMGNLLTTRFYRKHSPMTMLATLRTMPGRTLLSSGSGIAGSWSWNLRTGQGLLQTPWKQVYSSWKTLRS